MTNKLTHTLAGSILYVSLVVFSCCSVFGQTAAPSMRFALPERTRLLQGQLVDLVVEIRNAFAISGFKVTLEAAPTLLLASAFLNLHRWIAVAAVILSLGRTCSRSIRRDLSFCKPKQRPVVL